MAQLPEANRLRDPSPLAPVVDLVHAAPDQCLMAEAEFIVAPVDHDSLHVHSLG